MAAASVDDKVTAPVRGDTRLAVVDDRDVDIPRGTRDTPRGSVRGDAEDKADERKVNWLIHKGATEARGTQRSREASRQGLKECPINAAVLLAGMEAFGAAAAAARFAAAAILAAAANLRTQTAINSRSMHSPVVLIRNPQS